jgi:epsilon-lactone hydrolase
MLIDESARGLRDRGSWRSRGAAAVSCVTLRQLSSVLPPDRAWGLWASRQIVARVMDTFGPSLAGVTTQPVDTTYGDGRVVGEWVCGRGVRRHDTTRATSTRAVYYVHGSGYALCSPRTHRRLAGWLSTSTGLPVFVVDYRLAPRHRFPTAAEDVRRGWDWLTDFGGAAPQDVVIAGDSAGGHLAVDMLLQPDAVHPAGLVLLSPLVDLTFDLARTRETLRADPAIRARDAARLVELYCTGTEPGHPRLRLDVAGGRTLPPTLVHAGGAEMLAADAEALARDLRAAGGRCRLQVWPDQVHVFQALPRLTPEAAPAMAEITTFIAEALRTNDTPVGKAG